jgi:carboxymethylenebutenolidase
MSHNFPEHRAADFDPELWCLFDQYVHGDIDRRGSLDRAGRFATAAGMTATGLLAALSPDFARAQKVAPGDTRIKTEFVEFASPAGYGKVRALLRRGRAGGSGRQHQGRTERGVCRQRRAHQRGLARL